MNLDDRATRAAAALRRGVEPEIDLIRARTSLQRAAAGRRDHLRKLRFGGAAFATLILVGGLLAVAGDPPGRDVTTDERAVDAFDAESAAVLGAMPTSPIDGKASWRLPVLVKPQSGLADGDTVTVYGRGFGAHEYLGIVMCTSEADTGDEGVGACQLADGASQFGAVTYATASSEGNVVAEFVVRRHVTTPNQGEVDCFSAAERCLIGMGATNDYDKSGGSYIGFTGAPAFTEPTLAVDPAGPHAPGQEVVARVDGWVPGRAIRMQQCVEDRCQNLVDGKADAAGAAGLAVVLQPSIIDAETGEELACEDRCVLRANGIGIEGASAQPFPAPVPLSFTSPEPSAPLTTDPSPTTAPPPPPEATEPGAGGTTTAPPPELPPGTEGGPTTEPVETPGGPATTNPEPQPDETVPPSIPLPGGS